MFVLKVKTYCLWCLTSHMEWIVPRLMAESLFRDRSQIECIVALRCIDTLKNINSILRTFSTTLRASLRRNRNILRDNILGVMIKFITLKLVV